MGVSLARGAPLLVACLAVAALAAACAESHPLAAQDRAVAVPPEAVAWQPARRDDVIGYFESDRITGEAAGNVRKVFYSFAPDGTFSGAALVQDGAKATFQAVSGRWSLDGQLLRMGEDAPPARAFAAVGRLRLDSEGGSVTFHRGKAE